MRLKGQRPTGAAPGAASPSAFTAAATAAAAPAAAPAVVRLPGYGAWLKDGRPKPLKVGSWLGWGSALIAHLPWQAQDKLQTMAGVKHVLGCGATPRAGL